MTMMIVINIDDDENDGDDNDDYGDDYDNA